MTNYLTESLGCITRMSEADRNVLPPSHLRHVLRFARDVTENAESYFFEGSALSMASDLRIKDPEGLRGVLLSVFDAPKTVFLEAGGRERNLLLNPLREHIPQDVLPGEAIANRVGIQVKVLAPGLAKYSVCWNLPVSHEESRRARAFAKETMDASYTVSRTKLEERALFEFWRLGLNCYDGVIDVRNKPSFITPEELWQRYNSGHQDLRNNFKDLFGPTDREFLRVPHKRKLGFATWVYNTALMEEISLSETGRSYLNELMKSNPFAAEELYHNDPEDLSGEISNIAAMLAILLANDGDAVVRQEKPVFAGLVRQGTRRRAISQKDREPRVVNVVKLNVSDETVEKLYSGEPTEKVSTGLRRGPGRHLVRGHLFMARNGKMVFRRPHWRGKSDPDKPTVFHVHSS